MKLKLSFHWCPLPFVSIKRAPAPQPSPGLLLQAPSDDELLIAAVRALPRGLWAEVTEAAGMGTVRAVCARERLLLHGTLKWLSIQYVDELGQKQHRRVLGFSS